MRVLQMITIFHNHHSTCFHPILEPLHYIQGTIRHTVFQEPVHHILDILVPIRSSLDI